MYNLSALSLSALVGLYNELATKPTSKFKDKPTAVAKVQAIIDERGFRVEDVDGIPTLVHIEQAAFDATLPTPEEAAALVVLANEPDFQALVLEAIENGEAHSILDLAAAITEQVAFVADHEVLAAIDALQDLGAILRDGDSITMVAQTPVLPTITTGESAVLNAIARSEFTPSNGAVPASAQDTITWSNHLRIVGWTDHEVAGTLGSLQSKGLVSCEGSGDETTVAHTDLGFQVWSAQDYSAPIVNPKPEKAPKKDKAPKAPGAGRTSPMLTSKLELLVPANPKRPGSRTFQRYALYSTVKTAQEYMDACLALEMSDKVQSTRREILSDLGYDADRGFIALLDAK